MNRIVSAALLSVLATTVDAVVLDGRNYDRDVVFDGLDQTVFDSAGQDFVFGGNLAGWKANVAASFSDPTYNLAYTLSETNQSSPAFSNATFPDAKGIFFGDLAPSFNGLPVSVAFDITFINVSAAATTLGLAVFSGESLDVEVDKLAHSAGTFDLHSTIGLTSAVGDGSGLMTFTAGSEDGNGEYIATTVVSDGDILSWEYAYNGDKDGSNMIAFAAYSVPLPGGMALFLPAVAGLAWLGRRRTASPQP